MTRTMTCFSCGHEHEQLNPDPRIRNAVMISCPFCPDLNDELAQLTGRLRPGRVHPTPPVAPRHEPELTLDVSVHVPGWVVAGPLMVLLLMLTLFLALTDL